MKEYKEIRTNTNLDCLTNLTKAQIEARTKNGKTFVVLCKCKHELAYYYGYESDMKELYSERHDLHYNVIMHSYKMICPKCRKEITKHFQNSIPESLETIEFYKHYCSYHRKQM